MNRNLLQVVTSSYVTNEPFIHKNPKMIVDEVPCVVVDEEYPAVCVDPLLPALWQWTQVVLVPS